jgi:uncharacterized protein (DUF433 family)
MQPALVEERITRIPGLCGGRPTIRGTRMTVQTVLELIAAGMCFDEILEDYPYIEHEDLQASQQSAAPLPGSHTAL